VSGPAQSENLLCTGARPTANNADFEVAQNSRPTLYKAVALSTLLTEEDPSFFATLGVALNELFITIENRGVCRAIKDVVAIAPRKSSVASTLVAYDTRATVHLATLALATSEQHPEQSSGVTMYEPISIRPGPHPDAGPRLTNLKSYLFSHVLVPSLDTRGEKHSTQAVAQAGVRVKFINESHSERAHDKPRTQRGASLRMGLDVLAAGALTDESVQ
jgi:hypothetical protein